jgi:hypothetical protein
MLEANTREKLLKLRLLILRAAQKDSLGWWEDESLTQAGDYIASRLFAMDTEETARALALEAGRTRYRMAFGDIKDCFHLFRLDQTGQIEHELSEMRLSDVGIPNKPIITYDMLRDHLLALTGKPAAYEVVGTAGENRLQIKIKKNSAQTLVLKLAEALAWACLESGKGQLSLPFIRI